MPQASIGKAGFVFRFGGYQAMINRRNMLQGMAAGVGATLASNLIPGLTKTAAAKSGTASTGTPKRIIFFMQNQGFDPKTCVPEGMTSSGSLAKAKLPEPIEALEPYKERLHIINACTAFIPAPHTAPSSERSAAIVAATVCRPVAPRSTTNSVRHYRRHCCRICASAWTRSRT